MISAPVTYLTLNKRKLTYVNIIIHLKHSLVIKFSKGFYKFIFVQKCLSAFARKDCAKVQAQFQPEIYIPPQG